MWGKVSRSCELASAWEGGRGERGQRLVSTTQRRTCCLARYRCRTAHTARIRPTNARSRPSQGKKLKPSCGGRARRRGRKSSPRSSLASSPAGTEALTSRSPWVRGWRCWRGAESRCCLAAALGAAAGAAAAGAALAGAAAGAESSPSPCCVQREASQLMLAGPGELLEARDGEASSARWEQVRRSSPLAPQHGGGGALARGGLQTYQESERVGGEDAHAVEGKGRERSLLVAEKLRARLSRAFRHLASRSSTRTACKLASSLLAMPSSRLHPSSAVRVARARRPPPRSRSADDSIGWLAKTGSFMTSATMQYSLQPRCSPARRLLSRLRAFARSSRFASLSRRSARTDELRQLPAVAHGCQESSCTSRRATCPILPPALRSSRPPLLVVDPTSRSVLPRARRARQARRTPSSRGRLPCRGLFRRRRQRPCRSSRTTRACLAARASRGAGPASAVGCVSART